VNKRRKLIFISAALPLAAWTTTARAQTKSILRIGYLDAFAPEQGKPWREAFMQRLRELGWNAGQNVAFEYRSVAGKPDQYAALATELASANVNVIVTSGETLILAARKAAPTTPIVMTAVGDPVGAGLAASLARPGGTVTGMSNFAEEMPNKWLELLKESLPQAKRYAVLRNLVNPTHDTFSRNLEVGAAKLGVSLFSIGYRAPADIVPALDEMLRQKSAALLVLPDPVVNSNHALVAEFVTRNRVPSVYLFREQAINGGLLSYGPSRIDNWRRAATYVDRILRGANPAEMPIEQPTKFELVVNMKTANVLGIKIPATVMIRADEVIE
jgi:putative tryptophan/tyrosine transport system substrate-binding protein